MSTVHEVNEKCPVAVLAEARFGGMTGAFLLWERTCYPMDDEIAMDQLCELIAKADGWEDNSP